MAVTVLVVARAPEPGRAKTRLIPDLGVEGAAEVAAAALIDTLREAIVAAAPRLPVVALTGDLRRAARRGEVAALLARCDAIPQRGATFAQRLANAHRDAGPGVVQIGMDTPQLTAELLRRSAAGLAGADAVLGPAADGGWWLLAVRDAGLARALVSVEMSTARTGLDTAAALRRAGATVAEGPALRDVDTFEDALAVAEEAPGTRFAAALREHLRVPA